jgi:hypothetical protein
LIGSVFFVGGVTLANGVPNAVTSVGACDRRSLNDVVLVRARRLRRSLQV